MEAKDTAKLLKLLAQHGEEKIGSVVAKLRGISKSAPLMIEENAGKTSQLLPAIYDKAPAVEGQLIGDLVTQRAAKSLPDIEGQLAQAPKMIEQAIPSIENTAKSAASNLGADIPGIPSSKPFSMMDSIDNLSPMQKTVGAAGLITAAAAPLLMDNDGTTPPPISNQAPVVASDESSDDYDPNDSIQNPSKPYVDPNSATDYLNKSKGRIPAEIDQTPEILQPNQNSQADQFSKQIEEARDQDRQHQLLFGLLKAAQTGGSAMGGSKADTSYADTELAKQNNNVTNLKTSMDMKEEHANIEEKKQKRDPSSLTSKLYQDMLKEMNPKMNVEGLSAEQVEKVFPQIGMIISKREAIEARLLQAKIHNDTMALARSNKMDESSAKHLEEYRKARDPMMASVRSPLGKEVSRYNQSEHALGLIHGITDLNKLKDIQKKELAVALATMISPGLPHESTINSLSPETLNGQLAYYITKITGNPADTNTPGIGNLLKQSVENQRSISRAFIQKQQGAVDLSFAPHIAKNPEAYNKLSKQINYDSGIEENKHPTTVSDKTANGMINVVDKKTGKVKQFPVDIANKIINAHPEQYGSK